MSSDSSSTNSPTADPSGLEPMHTDIDISPPPPSQPREASTPSNTMGSVATDEQDPVPRFPTVSPERLQNASQVFHRFVRMSTALLDLLPAVNATFDSLFVDGEVAVHFTELPGLTDAERQSTAGFLHRLHQNPEGPIAPFRGVFELIGRFAGPMGLIPSDSPSQIPAPAGAPAQDAPSVQSEHPAASPDRSVDGSKNAPIMVESDSGSSDSEMDIVVNDTNIVHPPGVHVPPSQRWYAVIVGRMPGVFQGARNIPPNLDQIPGALVERHRSRAHAQHAFDLALLAGIVERVTLVYRCETLGPTAAAQAGQ